MEHKGVEYSVVQLTDDTGWRWEVRFDDGKSKSGTTRVSRALAIKLAETEIDRVLKSRCLWVLPVFTPRPHLNFAVT